MMEATGTLMICAVLSRMAARVSLKERELFRCWLIRSSSRVRLLLTAFLLRMKRVGGLEVFVRDCPIIVGKGRFS